MSQKHIVILALALIFLVHSESRGQVNSGNYYRITASHSGKCLDVAGGPGSVANGVPVQQWDCNNWDNQKWQFIWAEDNYYRIMSAHSGKSLDVAGGAGAQGNGATVQQWEYLGGDNQKWRLVRTDTDVFLIVAKHSGKTLDVTGGTGATANGVRVQQWANVGSANQTWAIEAVGPVSGSTAPPPSGRFRITLNGFICVQPTADHNLQRDGVDDEIYLRAETVLFNGRISVTQPTARSLVIGDTNNQAGRIRGGSGHNLFGGNGGFRAGDSFPGSPAWARFSAASNDRPPLIAWEGELTSGANGIVIVPSLWESDNQELNLVTGWENAIEELHAMSRQMNSLFTDPAGRYLYDFSPPPAVASSVASWRERKVEAQLRVEDTFKRNLVGANIAGNIEDRPIGMRRLSGDFFDFRPQAFVITYEVADHLARTNTFFGEGVMQIHYVEEEPHAGYVLYMQIERLP